MKFWIGERIKAQKKMPHKGHKVRELKRFCCFRVRVSSFALWFRLLTSQSAVSDSRVWAAAEARQWEENLISNKTHSSAYKWAERGAIFPYSIRHFFVLLFFHIETDHKIIAWRPLAGVYFRSIVESRVIFVLFLFPFYIQATRANSIRNIDNGSSAHLSDERSYK